MIARYFSPSLLALAIPLITMAQEPTILLTNAAGETVNGTTVELFGGLNDDPFQTFTQPLNTTNLLDQGRTINVKRYELDVLPGTRNYFCWGLCYDPIDAGARTEWFSIDPVYMNAGAEFNGFFGDYLPQGIEGTSTFRFVWYDVDNPDDSAYVDIAFSALLAGVAEHNALQRFDAYPNPTNGSNITLSYDLGGTAANTALVVYDLLGARVLDKALDTVQGKITLNPDELGDGLWIAALERDGVTLATQRLVITR